MCFILKMKAGLFSIPLIFILLSGAWAEIVNGIACKVGYYIITTNEFNRAYERMKNQAVLMGAPEPGKKEVMNRLIDNLLIMGEAEKRGIIVTKNELDKIVTDVKKQQDITDEEFAKELERENITLRELKEQYRTDILRTRLINYIISNEVKRLTEKELREFYENPENRRLFTIPASVELAQIYIPVAEDLPYQEALAFKKRVVDVYEEASKASNFEELVLKYSMAASKEKNRGYLGSFTRDQLLSFMRPEQVDLLFSLSSGEIAPPIRFQEGYYIFKVVKKSEKKQLSFEQAYENVKSYFLKQKGERAFNTWLLGAREAAKIQYVLEME